MKNYISYNIKDVIKDFLKRACGENKGFLFFVLSRDIMIVLCLCVWNELFRVHGCFKRLLCLN